MSSLATTWNHVLLPQHHQLVAASAITADVARARGYTSITAPAELARLGFNRAQQRLTPCLLLPVHTVDGLVAFHQIRPDTPRASRGKRIKYETPAGVSMRIDVPPTVRNQMGDPRIDLWITEGIRKADSAVSHGLVCIDLLGVWNWRGKNSEGGKTALPDWESIALNERRVFLAFDNDVLSKVEVRRALVRLHSFLDRKGAKVKIVRLPEAIP